MIRFPQTTLHPRHLLSVLGVLILVAALQNSFANETADRSSKVAQNPLRMNGGAEIECTTPDGTISKMANASDHTRSAAAFTREDDTLSYPLPEGETTFVIKLTSSAQLDRFTFVNENAHAAGALKISVSNDPLPATSPKWVEVDGSINFIRKRLFNLSMVGIEARYVKLSFTVEKASRIASVNF